MSDSQATPAASPAVPSQPATPTASQPVAATPQPAASPAPSPSTPASPPQEPPKERWEDILKNAREKTRREVEAEYRQRYSKYEAFERDPWKAVQSWLDEAADHSLYGPHIQQWAQKFTKPADPGQEPQPDVPIVDAQGQITGYTYSAQKLKEWNTWNQTQRQQELDTRFRKLEASTQELAAYRAQVQSQQWANQTLTQFRALPYFKEHEESIREALEEHEEWGDNLHAAYNHVLLTKILPTLSQAEQAKTLDTLTQKASGNTVSPSQPAPARPKFKSFKDAAEYYAKHPEEAASAAQRG